MLHLQQTDQRLFGVPFNPDGLGLIDGADDWLAVRKLRHLMVHAYLDRAETLHMALYAAYEHARKNRRTIQISDGKLVDLNVNPAN